MIPFRPDLASDEELTAWVDHLVRDSVPEGLEFDYKQEISIERRPDKRELGKDVSALANAVGGTVVYGIREEQQAGQNVPALSRHGCEVAPGLTGRVRDILSAVLQPRLVDSVVRELEYGDASIIIVWVSSSPLKPHMVEGYADRRFYLRSGDRSRPMDEHEVARAYAERDALERRADEFLASPWARRPLLIPPPHGVVWSANYAVLPTVPIGDWRWTASSTFATYNLASPRWLASPRGTETDYSWDGAEFEVPFTTRFVWPKDAYAVYDGGEVVLWEEGLFTAASEINGDARDFLWRHDREAARLDHFLRLAAGVYDDRAFSGPIRVAATPSWARRETDLNGVRIGVRLGGSSASILPLRFPAPLWRADIVTSAAVIRDDPAPVVEQIFDAFLRFFGVDRMPDAMLRTVRDGIEASRNQLRI